MRTRILPGSCLSLLLLAATCFSADIPRKAPEFAIDTNSGKQILLSQARGKVVALAFILTTCPHCQHTVQILTKLQNEYGPRGFQVLDRSISQSADFGNVRRGDKHLNLLDAAVICVRLLQPILDQSLSLVDAP